MRFTVPVLRHRQPLIDAPEGELIHGAVHGRF